MFYKNVYRTRFYFVHWLTGLRKRWSSVVCIWIFIFVNVKQFGMCQWMLWLKLFVSTNASSITDVNLKQRHDIKISENKYSKKADLDRCYGIVDIKHIWFKIILWRHLLELVQLTFMKSKIKIMTKEQAPIGNRWRQSWILNEI